MPAQEIPEDGRYKVNMFIDDEWKVRNRCTRSCVQLKSFQCHNLSSTCDDNVNDVNDVQANDGNGVY